MRRRRSRFIPDDTPIEEIEALFEAQRKEEEQRNSSKKKIDPLYYAMYPDELSDLEVEKRFALIEQQATEENREEIARKIFLENATAAELPNLEMWMNGIDDWGHDSENDSEFDGEAVDDDIESDFNFFKSKGKGTGKRVKTATFSEIFHIERFGAFIERWPINKLSRTIPISAESLVQVMGPKYMKNQLEIQSGRNFFRENMIRHELTQITAPAIKRMMAHKNVDGIVMDPPIGIGGFTPEKFTQFLRDIVKVGENPIILIWVDTDTIECVVDACTRCKLEACDSIAVELFNSMMEPLLVECGAGFKIRSRMLLMYRVHFMDRSSLAQQRIKDTGWGVAYPRGKSHGRMGMPMVPHEILEALLPNKKKKQRTFIEIWPSKYGFRDGWISFDEP